jgi:hypothetical protein
MVIETSTNLELTNLEALVEKVVPLFSKIVVLLFNGDLRDGVCGEFSYDRMDHGIRQKVVFAPPEKILNRFR